MWSARGTWISSKTCVIVSLGLRSEIVDIIWNVVWKKETCGIMTCGMNDLETDLSLFYALIWILCGWLGSKHLQANLIPDVPRQAIALVICFEPSSFNRTSILFPVFWSEGAVHECVGRAPQNSSVLNAEADKPIPPRYCASLSCICLIDPFNYRPVYGSLPQPWYNPMWLTWLKTPTNLLINLDSVHY